MNEENECSEPERKEPRVEPGKEPWRKVFGKVPKEITAEIDRIIEAEFGQIDLDSWR